MKQTDELLSISDFFLTLFRGKRLFIAVWLLVIALAVVYLLIAEKTYKLSGTVYVGRLQERLLEEGEFVAQKLKDYSFVKRALDNAGVELEIPVSRLVRDISTNVVNEVKKVRDVGIVELSVEYQDQQKTYEIYKAVTDQLIAEHQQLLEESTQVFKEMEDMFWEDEARLRESVEADEKIIAEANKDPEFVDSVPSYLLLGHTIAEKRTFHQNLVKDIHYIKLEGDSAVKSFNSKLAAEPQVPDEPFKPRKALTLILAAILATIAATTLTLGMDYYRREIKPRLNG